MMSVDTTLSDLIANMSFKNSYWGYLFSRVRRKSDISLPYPIAVAPESDGTLCLLYNPERLENVPVETMALILEHEGLHLLNKHISRFISLMAIDFSTSVKEREEKQKKFMLSADCAVNTLMAMPQKISMGPGEKMGEPIFPSQYDLPPKKSCEFYYHHIVLPPDEDDSQSPSGHESWSQAMDGQPDKLAVSRKLDSYVADMAKDAAKSVQKSRGHLPSYLQELISDLVNPPKLPYYYIIQKLVKASRLSKLRRAPTRLNKKRVFTFFLNDFSVPEISPFPGYKMDYSFDIGILLDTSGSMTLDNIKEGLTATRSIIEKDKYVRTTVIEIDTEIKKEYQIKRISDIQFNIKGRGGTHLQQGLKRMKELGVDVVVVFTDGGCENINEIERVKLPKKIIWVVTKGGSTEQFDKVGYSIMLE